VLSPRRGLGLLVLFMGKNWNLNQNMSLWVRLVRGRRMGCADYVFVGKNAALLFEDWIKLGVLFLGQTGALL
jgi:hypothetical protein